MKRTFRVKNFERFQHYKDRSPPWIKLYNELLDDYQFSCLQDASKLHLILIWLLASRSDNVLPYDPAWIGKRINATSKVDLDGLREAGFIVENQELHNAEQVASNPLAGCKHDARPEREGETELETEIYRSNWPNDFREQFWNAYPRKVGKKAAIRKLEAIRLSGEIEFPDLLRAIGNLSASEERFLPHPTTWLNEGRYLDNLPARVVAAAESVAKPPRPGMPTDAELRAKYAQRGEDERTAAEGSSVLASGVEVHSGEPDRLGMDRSKLGRTQSMVDVFCGPGLGAIRDEAIEARSLQEGDDAGAMA